MNFCKKKKRDFVYSHFPFKKIRECKTCKCTKFMLKKEFAFGHLVVVTSPPALSILGLISC